MNFIAKANIYRHQRDDEHPEEIIAYSAEIRVNCAECGQEFEFFGVPLGYSHYRPTVSIDGKELRVPLVIPGTEPEKGLAGFSVTHQVFDEAEAVKQ